MNTNIFTITCDLYDAISNFDAYTLICERRKIFELIDKVDLTLRWVDVTNDEKKGEALDLVGVAKDDMERFFKNLFFDSKMAINAYKDALYNVSEALKITKSLTLVNE